MRFSKNNTYFMLGCIKAGIGEIGITDTSDDNIINKYLLGNSTKSCVSYKINDHSYKNMKVFGLDLNKYFSVKIFKNKIIPIEKDMVNNLEFWKDVVMSIKEGGNEYVPYIDGYMWIKKKIEDITLYVLFSKREHYAIIIQNRFRSHLARLRVNIMRCIPNNLFHPIYGSRRRRQLIDERNWVCLTK